MEKPRRCQITESEHLRFLDSFKSDEKNFYYLVYQKNLAVGVVSLNYLSIRHRNAFCGLYKNPDITGAGKTLLKCLLSLAFEALSLHTLKLEVISDNTRALELYKSFGFEIEGKLRDFVFKGGAWKDVIIMGILNHQNT